MRDEFYYKIEEALFRRVDAVKVDKKGNLLNKAVLSEGFYRGFINILFGWELVNANAEEQNFPGIDLIDRKNKVAVQVSVTCNHEKVQGSVDRFSKPDSECWHFYFLAILNSASELKEDITLPDWLSFNKKADVLDTARLMQKVQEVNGDRDKIDRLLKYIEEKNARDDICKTLYSALKDVRANHPSFKLMTRDDVDKRLLPDGNDIKPMDAYGSSDGYARQKVWDIIKSEQKQGFRDIVIEGEGGIGKSVSLLSVTEDEELLMLVPAIYIHMYDLIKDNRKITIKEFIDNHASGCAQEIFRLTRDGREPQIMFLLDGLNEVAPEQRYDLMREIREWKRYHPGAQLILASRPLGGNDLELALGEKARRVELAVISDENVSVYLEEQGLKPPLGEHIWEVLKRPLFLMLYAKTACLVGQKACGRYPLAVRKSVNAGALIWNYLQRQLLINDNKEWVICSIFANEYFAPYIAYRMVGKNRFDLSFEEADKFVEEAKQRLCLRWLPKHIAAVGKEYYRSSARILLPEIEDWTSFILDSSGIFTKKSEKTDSVTYAFLHQNFRDCLAAAYLVGQAEAAEAEEMETKSAALPEVWRVSQSSDVINYAAELIENDVAENLWEMNRRSQQYSNPSYKRNDTATYVQLELRKHMPEKWEPDFSGMDIRGMSLAVYMLEKGGNIKLFLDKKNSKGSLLDRDVFRSAGHTGTVNCVAALKDGRIVSGSDDKTLRIWDPNTWECIKTLQGHTDSINCVAVLKDGRIVSGSGDETIRIWDPNTGECIRKLQGHSKAVSCVAVLNDGQIVSGSWDRTLRIWDPNTGECISTLQGHSGAVSCVAVLKDGQIVSGSGDETIRIWDPNTGECIRTLQGHIDSFDCVAVSFDCVAVLKDGRIVIGSNDGTLRILNPNTGECIRTLQGYTRSIKCVAVLKDGRIVSNSSEGSLRLWDPNTGECIRTLQSHSYGIECVAVLKDGRIVSGSMGGTLRLWDPNTGECIRTLQGHTDSIKCVAALKDGRIVSGSMGGTLRLWDPDTGECIKTLQGHTDLIYCVAALKDGRIVSGSRDRTLRLWDPNTGECIRTLNGGSNSINCVAAIKDGRIVSSSYGDTTLRIWDPNTGECISTLQGYTDSIFCVAALKDGRIVSSSYGDTTLRIWDPNTGECISTLQGHSNAVDCVVVLKDGRIVSGSYDKTLRIWDPNTGECIRTLQGHTDSFDCVAVLKDGRIISNSYGDATLRIWDPNTGECTRTLQGHTGSINCVAVLKDGRVVSGSNDNTLRIWDIKNCTCIDVLEAAAADITEMDVSLAKLDEDEKQFLWRNGAKV